MNKIASYLNEHVIGEVSSLRSVRKKYSEDKSLLSIMPEIVLFPATTNDIRKTARFSWQLSEKGHSLPLTTRGGGTDTTGAAIGKGIVIDMSKHLNRLLHMAAKERIVHVQAGASIRTVNEALQWHGLDLAAGTITDDSATIGGWLATQGVTPKSDILDKIHRLEVVLANGDIIETGKISKRELNKKKGLQTLEGEIYRKIDGLIEDNDETIKGLSETQSSVGYSSIGQVKFKDGSVDLTPLFIGSQGTLGVISEIVLKPYFLSREEVIIVVPLPSNDAVQPVIDALGKKKLAPTCLELFDQSLFEAAEQAGKKYSVLGGQLSGPVMVMIYSDFSDRKRRHKFKKTAKILKKQGIEFRSSLTDPFDDIVQVQRVGSVLEASVADSETIVPIVNGSIIPGDKRDEFLAGLAELEQKVHINLPTHIDLITGAVTVYPKLHLGEVSDKQRIFRILKEYSQLVRDNDGSFIGTEPEGRLKATTAWEQLDESTKELFTAVKEAFDPYGILNPNVKQPNDLKHLVASLKSSH